MVGIFHRDSPFPSSLLNHAAGSVLAVGPNEDHTVNHPLRLGAPLLFFTRSEDGLDTE